MGEDYQLSFFQEEEQEPQEDDGVEVDEDRKVDEEEDLDG